MTSEAASATRAPSSLLEGSTGAGTDASLGELLRSRRSIRGYRPDPVPREVIREILAEAVLSPSSMNTQPWKFHVLTGDVLDRIREENTRLMLAGAPIQRDVTVAERYEGVHRDRQVDIAKRLFGAMGIAREDQEARLDWTMRGFRQFDAPVSIVIAHDRSLEAVSPIAHFDLGAVVHALVLSAWSRGLGTVINSQGIMQGAAVRREAGIPDDHVIFTAVALGYPDEDFAANHVRSARESVDDVARFVGFD
ncbi:MULTISPECIES: nitroreductase [Aeromicrobium]|uniref:nitroreductase n=1 Tax=Aeromicrobium TaxID=2040 RepID=UPI00257FFF4C|nr:MULTISPECIES: nitroreductase [Aeromicrobium]